MLCKKKVASKCARNVTRSGYMRVSRSSLSSRRGEHQQVRSLVVPSHSSLSCMDVEAIWRASEQTCPNLSVRAERECKRWSDQPRANAIFPVAWPFFFCLCFALRSQPTVAHGEEGGKNSLCGKATSAMQPLGEGGLAVGPESGSMWTGNKLIERVRDCLCRRQARQQADDRQAMAKHLRLPGYA